MIHMNLISLDFTQFKKPLVAKYLVTDPIVSGLNPSYAKVLITVKRVASSL